MIVALEGVGVEVETVVNGERWRRNRSLRRRRIVEEEQHPEELRYLGPRRVANRRKWVHTRCIVAAAAAAEGAVGEEGAVFASTAGQGGVGGGGCGARAGFLSPRVVAQKQTGWGCRFGPCELL